LRIVIVGGRGVGASIAEYFSKRGDDVVVVEGDEEVCDRLAKSLDVTVYCGDAKSEKLLRDAGAEEADVLFAVSGDDSLNIWVASVAKRELGVPTVVVKVDERESAERARSAGADVVVCSEELVFERLIEAVTSPAYTFLLKREGFAVVAVKVLPDSGLIGTSVSELRERGLNVVAVFRGAGLTEFEDLVLEADDEMIVAGPEEKISELLKEVFE
jgi:trk system potassium uptake protein TrkA